MFSVSTALFTPEAPDVSAEKGSDKEIMHSSVSIGIRRFNLKFNHRPKAIRLDQQYVFLLSALFYPVFFSFLSQVLSASKEKRRIAYHRMP